MTRVVSLFLPTWPTDRARRKSGNAAPPRETPLVLAGHDGRRRAIVAADAAAQATGLRVGMPATKAQALVPGLLMQEADPAADLEALGRLAAWALRRYAPVVSVDPPDGLVIDTTGADHLHGGEEAMLSDIVVRLAASGTEVRAAVADTWGAAHAFARHLARPVFVCPRGDPAGLLAPLPVSVLRLARDIVAGLHALGLDAIGDLLAQPRAPLVLRFGPQLGRRLDQALGHIGEPIEAVRPPETIEVRRAFAEPISAAETISRYVGKLVPELCAILEVRGLGVRRLDLVCHRVDSRAQAVRVGTGQPVRDAVRLTRLLREKIGTIEPGFGIEMMNLAATTAEPLRDRQAVSAFIEEPEADLSDLLDTLANRVGERRLYRVLPVASDVPERSVARASSVSPETNESWPDGWPRPVRLLASPEPIDAIALLPDNPPVAFTWRGIRRRVRCADGPERIFGEWWKRDAELAAVRDYFRVEDDSGERYWIFRSGDGEDPGTGSRRWFMHGVFG